MTLFVVYILFVDVFIGGKCFIWDVITMISEIIIIMINEITDVCVIVNEK